MHVIKHFNERELMNVKCKFLDFYIFENFKIERRNRFVMKVLDVKIDGFEEILTIGNY